MLYEGSAEDGAAAQPKRTQLYIDNLTNDQQELIVKFSSDKRSIGIQI